MEKNKFHCAETNNSAKCKLCCRKQTYKNAKVGKTETQGVSVAGQSEEMVDQTEHFNSTKGYVNSPAL